LNRIIEIIESGYLNGSGGLLADGTVTSYLAGTSTLQALYQDFACTTLHLNPLTLSAEGRATAYTNTRVKLVFKTSGGATVRTVDNVGTADSDLSSSSASTLAGDGLRAPGDGTIAVNTDGVTLENSSDAVQMKGGGVHGTQSGIFNGAIATSVGSSQLTIALKTQDGGDPAAADPVYIAFRSSTLTDGTYNRRTVATALPTVVSSGSTLGHTNATEWPIYVYALDNSGSVELAYSTSPVDERYLQTTTAEGGAGAADSPAVLYSTTARSNVPVRLLAVLKSTQTTAGTWAAVPTAISPASAGDPIGLCIARPSSATAGIGGVATSTTSGSFSTTSTTFVDVTNLSATLTTSGRPVYVGLIPDGTTAVSVLSASIGSGTSIAGVFKIFRGATLVAQTEIGAGGASGALAVYEPVGSLWAVDFPAAGTYTYKLQAESSSASVTTSVSNAKLIAYEI
jgi:hypothetical protein